MDQYLIRWANKVQGVTFYEYMNMQHDSGIESEEPQNFTSGPYSGEVVRDVKFPGLPTVKELPPIPPYSNPFHHDMFNMGCDVSGPWMAMFSGHSGLKQAHNKTPEEEKSLLPVFNNDPKYIIFVNQKTGQRFRLDFPEPEDVLCRHCKLTIVKGRDGVWNGSGEVLSQYCYVDPEHGSRLHEPDPEIGANDAVGKT